MPIVQAILLGLIQGATEFLPVSSSAHLALAPWFFGWKDQGLSFDIALHLGTLAAVVLYFIRDWIQVLGQAVGLRLGSDPFLKDNPRLLWLLIAATIPAGVAGLLLKSTVEHTLRNPYVIGSMLIGVAFILLIAERSGLQRKHLGTVSSLDAMAIGFAQALALVPGTSRSGITIAAGLFRDLDRPTAARFSFLLSVPAIIGAVGKDLYDLWKTGGIPADQQAAFIAGILASAVSGTLVIAFFLQYLRRAGLMPFVWYRIGLGVLTIAMAYFYGYQAV
jgi:undecaprenyl-diphosphatase